MNKRFIILLFVLASIFGMSNAYGQSLDDTAIAFSGTEVGFRAYGAYGVSSPSAYPPTGPTAPPAPIPVTSYSSTPTAIVYCGGGVVDLYFDDVLLHWGTGFDDPTYGALRRNTFCKV